MDLDPNSDLYWETEGRSLLPPDWDEAEFRRTSPGIPERGRAFLRRIAAEDWAVETNELVQVE